MSGIFFSLDAIQKELSLYHGIEDYEMADLNVRLNQLRRDLKRLLDFDVIETGGCAPPVYAM